VFSSFSDQGKGDKGVKKLKNKKAKVELDYQKNLLTTPKRF
jgi:hypothetical protein